MNKIKAKLSFSKDLYECRQNWPQDTFCQGGGDGVVFQEGSIEDSLKDTNEALDTISTVLGASGKKKHYRTAFFEAFPKNPSCFLRGEGKNIEEAELNAWKKWEQILACKSHDFDRKGRTDGYGYCKHCPLAGTFLDPLTKCIKCSCPTTDSQDKNNNYYCYQHYYELPSNDQIVVSNELTKYMSWYTPENQMLWFIELKIIYQLSVHHYGQDKVTSKIWKDILKRHFQFYRNHIEQSYNPFLGKKTKTEAEIHELILQAIPVIFEKIKETISNKNLIT